MDVLTIDGAVGEGGGQILRSALSLSMLEGRPIRLQRIRAGRARPGLMRQHLSCVEAAQRIAAAEVSGAAIGSTELLFRPQTLSAGTLQLDIGSAGSCTLVLQTLLPALLRAEGPSVVRIRGGTHNPLAPSSDFLHRVFLPQLARMGAQVALETERVGLAPAGGGELVLRVQHGPLRPLSLHTRGTAGLIEAEALCAGVPPTLAVDALAAVAHHYRRPPSALPIREPGRTGPGLVLQLWAPFAEVCELVTLQAGRQASAVALAARACTALDAYLQGSAVVGEHLSDQLLLPLWIAGGGDFLTGPVSDHLRTNAWLINQFDGPRVRLIPEGPGTRVVVG